MAQHAKEIMDFKNYKDTNGGKRAVANELIIQVKYLHVLIKTILKHFIVNFRKRRPSRTKSTIFSPRAKSSLGSLCLRTFQEKVQSTSMLQ